MDALPEWPEATVAILVTGERHAIPVSLAMRAGDRELVVGLAPRRESLANLRSEPRCAIACLAPGVAFTAYGRAVAIDDDGPVVGVRIEVDEIADHDHRTFEITGGVEWRWTEDAARERDAGARDALRRLAG